MWTTRHRRNSRGFALASAIFILVVLAALAVGITLLTTQSQTGVARDMLGSRAYQAARAGLEWRIRLEQPVRALRRVAAGL